MKANRIKPAHVLRWGVLPLMGWMAFSLAGCQDGPQETSVVDDAPAVVRIDTVPVEAGPDRTLYGKGGEFGMSTFSLVLPNGEEYDVTRVSEQGVEGRIYGSTQPGKRYALFLEEDGETLRTLINLDELDRFVKGNYYIYNGELVLTLDGNREWVDIEKLSAEGFRAKGRGGKDYQFKP